jgi:hypothetical protein
MAYRVGKMKAYAIFKKGDGISGPANGRGKPEIG